MENWMCAIEKDTLRFVFQHPSNLEREPHHNHTISYLTYKVPKVKEIVLKIQLTFFRFGNRYFTRQYLLMGEILEVMNFRTISFKR
jgi:hypothetical protein